MTDIRKELAEGIEGQKRHEMATSNQAMGMRAQPPPSNELLIMRGIAELLGPPKPEVCNLCEHLRAGFHSDSGPLGTMIMDFSCGHGQPTRKILSEYAGERWGIPRPDWCPLQAKQTTEEQP